MLMNDYICDKQIFIEKIVVNFTVLLYKILLFINSVEIGRWVNIISAVIVLNLLFSILQITTKKDWVSLMGTIAFGFSFTFWKNTENVEVYTFCLIWVSLYCLFAFNLSTINNLKRCYRQV